jgi:hypothetical protein
MLPAPLNGMHPEIWANAQNHPNPTNKCGSESFMVVDTARKRMSKSRVETMSHNKSRDAACCLRSGLQPGDFCMQQRLPGDFMAVIAPCRRGMAVYALSQILKRPILPVVRSVAEQPQHSVSLRKDHGERQVSSMIPLDGSLALHRFNTLILCKITFFY